MPFKCRNNIHKHVAYIGVPDRLPAEDGAGSPVESGDDEPGRLARAQQGVVVVVGVHDDVRRGAVDVCKN